MRHIQKIGAALSAALALAALATNAAAATLLIQCDSSTWPNNQVCAHDTSTWKATVVTSSNAARTAHSISITMPLGGGGTGDNFRFAAAIALDGNGRTIAGSSVSSIGPNVVKSFSTDGSVFPRRLQTQLFTQKTTPGPFSPRNLTEDVWPQTLNTRHFASNGSTAAHCRVNGSSDAALTTHTASALQVTNNANATCIILVLDSNGSLIHNHQDNGAGTPTIETFTTTVAGRPRRFSGVPL